MGDWLRRVLYPLLLPVIVGTVWLCGWVRQQDDRAARNRWIPTVAREFEPPSRGKAPRMPATVAEPVRTEFFATAAAEESGAADEP